VIWWFAAGHECLDHSPPALWPAGCHGSGHLPVLLHTPRSRHASDRDLARIRTTAIDRVRSAADGSDIACAPPAS
jgi:hypothetical protein